MYRKIGILCAGDSELAPFLPHLEHVRTSEKALLKFYEGTLCGLPAVLLYSGVCKVNAAIAAQLLIDTYRADAVINARFAPLTVDMESAAVAHVCHANGVPFLAIRTVTDTADHSGAGNFELNCERASAIAKDFTLALLREIQNA